MPLWNEYHHWSTLNWRMHIVFYDYRYFPSNVARRGDWDSDQRDNSKPLKCETTHTLYIYYRYTQYRHRWHAWRHLGDWNTQRYQTLLTNTWINQKLLQTSKSSISEDRLTSIRLSLLSDLQLKLNSWDGLSRFSGCDGFDWSIIVLSLS